MKRILVWLARKIISHYNLGAFVDVNSVIVVQSQYMRITSFRVKYSSYEKPTCEFECESII